MEYLLKNSLFKMATVLMTVLLLFTVSIHTFHQHDKQQHSFEKSKSSVIASDDCKICDYAAHHFNQALITPNQSVDLKITELPKATYGGYCISSYKFTLQGFTNKGPPVVLA